ncbi:MAG TPA: LuxR C-terminal-related transcriptional regulator [Actinocrinis sp.]|nr:LuxR C-terminal-related transcriptional regulator [Actinocrinis sp.]
MPTSCETADFLARSRSSWLVGHLESGIKFAEAAFQGAGDECGETCTHYAGLWLALLLSQIRRTYQAQRVLDTIDASDEAKKDEQLAVATVLVRATVSAAAGDFAKAALLASTGLRKAEEIGLKAWTPLGNFVMALTALRRGDLSIALHYAQCMEEDAIFGRKMLPPGQSAWVILQIAEAEKGRDKVARLAAELLVPGPITRQLLISEPAAAPWLVRLMLKCGERALAEEGVRAAHLLAAANPTVRSVEAAAVHAVGLFEDDADKLAWAAQLHIDRWAQASAIEDVGRLLSGQEPERPKAAENLENARTGYAEIGSLRDSCRVKSRLRRINTAVQQRESDLPSSGVAGLTDTEYAVARLVAEGFTNRQAADQLYLSRHTIAFHLRKIFRKLGVASRVQLAATWAELDVVGNVLEACPAPY